MTGSRLNSPSPSKPRNLRYIRKQITISMQQLASIKAEEAEFLTNGNLELQNALSQARHWTKERDRLTSMIRDTQSHLNNMDDSNHRTLYAKASELEDEIRRREEELAALKAQLRRIRDELSGSQSAVEAEVAAYKEHRRELDRDVAEFLRLPPLFQHVPFTSKYLEELPPKRRNLHVAQQYWEDESEHLAARCSDVQKHYTALSEGVEVWQDVVEKITGLERYLEDAIRANTAPARILGELGPVIEFVEQKHDYAVARGWNLLITAIGAELEALMMGKAVVQEMIDKSNENEKDDVERKDRGKGKERAVSPARAEDRPSRRTSSAGLSSPALKSTRSPPVTATRSPPIHDNDDPDPELLISHQDTDTD